MWDAESGRVLATLIGHQDIVRTAGFSPDGKRVVTASFDQTARGVWDTGIVDFADLVTWAEYQLPIETK
jgi:WD40 repeat protein